MPKEMERKLRQQAIQRRLTGKKKNAYVYGTMRKTGWKPKNQRESFSDGEHEYRE